MSKLFSVSLAVVLFAGATAALATVIEYDNPPPWRGEWSTTSQVWGFSGPQHDDLPPDGPALGGEPPLDSTMLLVEGGTWGAGEIPHYGVWDLPEAAHIDVIVDNHEPPNDYKWVWVQLTWQHMFGEPIDPLSLLTDFSASGPDGPYQHTDPEVIIDNFDPASGWHNTTYEWYIYPNPVDESFTIGINDFITVDVLVIDTWCIPEPATLIVLALGLIPALLRRRKNA